MRIAVCTLGESVQAPTGLLSYFAQLARCLPAVDPGSEYHFLVSRETRDFISRRAAPVKFSMIGWDDSRRALRLLSEHFLLGPWLHRNRVDLLYMANAGVSPLVLPRSVALVQAVFSFHHLTGEVAWSRRLYRRLFFRRALRRARRIVLNSSYSAGLLSPAAPDVGDKVRVIPHGLDQSLFHNGPLDEEDLGALRALNFEQPYILFVSQIYPYKKVDTAVEAFCRFVRQTGAPHRLVVAGRFDPKFGEGEPCRKRLVETAADNGLADRLVFTEGLPVRTLRALYRGAFAYVQPSTAETFGRTSLEAMACGCPVVAARAAASPEVIGDAGLYFEPGDAHDCALALERLYRSPPLRDELTARGIDRARGFRIEREAQALAAVFAESMAAS